MSTSEKYISEALVKDKAKIPISLRIKDGSVVTSKLADGAVTTPKIADLNITTEKLKDSAVTTEKVADKNITTGKLADLSVTSEKIANGNVTTEKLDDDAVVTDKIKDNNVTWEKLNDKVQKVVEAGTGVDGDLIADMEEWNDRIAALESAKLTPKTLITAKEITEFDGGATVNLLVTLSTDLGQIDDDKNYTDKVLNLNIGGVEGTVNKGTYNEDYIFTKPSSLTITASGTAKYKGVATTFPKATKTIYAVLPSYMGYVESLSEITDTVIQGLQKNVKHSLSGSYNITNSYASGYFIVAVPKDGAVNGVNKIVQHGLMDAVQTIERHDTSNYNVYVCSTAHNQGTYNFIIS